MTCVTCNGKTEQRLVDYEIHFNGDHLVVPVKAEVCEVCDEQYFDQKTVEYLQKVENTFKRTKRSYQEIGTVFKAL